MCSRRGAAGQHRSALHPSQRISFGRYHRPMPSPPRILVTTHGPEQAALRGAHLADVRAATSRPCERAGGEAVLLDPQAAAARTRACLRRDGRPAVARRRRPGPGSLRRGAAPDDAGRGGPRRAGGDCLAGGARARPAGAGRVPRHAGDQRLHRRVAGPGRRWPRLAAVSVTRGARPPNAAHRRVAAGRHPGSRRRFGRHARGQHLPPPGDPPRPGGRRAGGGGHHAGRRAGGGHRGCRSGRPGSSACRTTRSARSSRRRSSPACGRRSSRRRRQAARSGRRRRS